MQRKEKYMENSGPTPILPSKVRGKPFEKGNSGNPAGKAKGTRNAATLALEAMLDGESESLMRLAIDLAHAGNKAALRLVIERILPPRRERPMQFQLPRLETAADAVAAINAIAEGIARGELSESEAASANAVVNTFMKSLEFVDYERKFAALEEKVSKLTKEVEEDLA